MYELHKLVFENNVAQISPLLKKDLDLEDKHSLQDQHGNTPLHLATMLGHKECVHLLLKHNHPVAIKNYAGWTPLQEAVSYGDRQTVMSLYKGLRKQNRKSIKDKRPQIKSALEKIGGDFFIQLHWDFQSWVPFVSRVLPSDTCNIYRWKSRIRMDSSLEDFSDMKWVRGDISFIIDFDAPNEPEVVLLDNKRKVYERMQKVSDKEKNASIEDEVDIAMSSDIVDAAIKTKEVSVDRLQTGWIFKHDKTDKIGRFSADYYKMTNLNFVTRKRREHLSDDDIKRNKALRDAFSKGDNNPEVLEECTSGNKNSRRKSLPPPDRHSSSWEQYTKASIGNYQCLGRKPKLKTNSKSFDATLAMSNEFPVQIDSLLLILEAFGPRAKLLNKLQEFIKLKLPPGFPVRVDVPVFPTVTGTASFLQFEFKDDLKEEFFSIPPSFRHEPGWFEKTSKERQQASIKNE